MKVSDTGGAKAIQGFNYQKASIMLVMIKNFKLKEFSIIPEARDDFEVVTESKRFFIQVKGGKNLSISKLTYKNKKNEQSVLEKSIQLGKDSDIRKLFVWSLIPSTKDELQEVHNQTLVYPLYEFSESGKQTIIERTKLDDCQNQRLNNQFIFITPFENNKDQALTYLKGIMVEQKLIADNSRAQILLGELSIQIDKKSEISIKSKEDYNRKVISGEYLRKLFTTAEQMERFNIVLDSLNMNLFKKNKIKQEKLKIPLLFQNEKNNIKKRVSVESLIDLPEKDVLNKIIDIADAISNNNINDEQLWALAIECYCELGEEIYDN